MSGEENEAIETLKEVARDDFDTLGDDISPKMAQNILNVIDNQQKEIKKEKSRIMELAELLDKQENEIKFLKGELEIQEGCSISKDKIKEWLDRFELEEDLQDKYDELLGSEAIYKFLKKLLEEN